ncbi:NDP-sugar synthase [Luteolibacter sp. AS25]|uniref:nucleotidyltransferase family protein n=1 Tax=Luteolibacter sp. AS25 TaxID=3135776 RepID=UPI00398AACDC
MPSLLVLAAGMGSRYGGLKQLDPMGPNGETVLDYSVFDAISAGFDRVIFVIREDFVDAFKEGIGSRFAGKIAVEYAFQRLDDLPAPFTIPEGREKPWGTTHAVRAARHLIDGSFAVVNADDFYGQNSYVKAFELLSKSTGDQCGLIGFPLVNTLSEHGHVNRGICEVTDEGILKSVEEYVEIGREDSGKVVGQGLDGIRRDILETTPVSMNFWLFPKSFIDDLEDEFISFLGKHGHEPKSECYIPTVVDSLISSGKTTCRVVKTSSSWFGVTYPDDKAYVVASIQDLIQKGVYPAKL